MKVEFDFSRRCPHCDQPFSVAVYMGVPIVQAPEPQRHSYIDSSGELQFTPPTAPGDAHG